MCSPSWFFSPLLYSRWSAAGFRYSGGLGQVDIGSGVGELLEPLDFQSAALVGNGLYDSDRVAVEIYIGRALPVMVDDSLWVSMAPAGWLGASRSLKTSL